MKRNGGKENTRDDRFLKQFLSDNDYIRQYEIKYILKAFKLTILYFLENTEEFEIKDFFKFKNFSKKEWNLYVRYRDEWEVVPEHNDMKMETSKNLRDYLNARNKFKNVEKRQKLPDGTTKFKNIY